MPRQKSEWTLFLEKNGLIDLERAAKQVKWHVFAAILDNPYKEKSIELIGPRPEVKLLKFTGDDCLRQAWDHINSIKE